MYKEGKDLGEGVYENGGYVRDLLGNGVMRVG